MVAAEDSRGNVGAVFPEMHTPAEAVVEDFGLALWYFHHVSYVDVSVFGKHPPYHCPC